MKKRFLLIIFCILTIIGHAKVDDVLKGILPINEHSLIQSLNGT